MLQLLHQFFKALGRVVAKHLAELLHEAVKVGFLASHLVADHLVQGAHHVAGGSLVFFRHAFDLIHHLLAHVLGHLIFQGIQQFLKLLLGVGVHKVIFHQVFNLTGKSFREGIQFLVVVFGALL